MKVVNFISGNDLGGPKQSFLLYSKLLRDEGYQNISVIRSGSKLSTLLKDNNLNFEEISYTRTLNPIFRHYSIKKLRDLLLRLHPDIILIHKQIDIELIYRAIGNGAKLIGIIHGYNARNIENADALIAVSSSIKEFLRKNSYSKPIYVIPNMIDNHSVPALKTIPKIPTIGTMGIFRRKKGHHILIKALSILKKRGINFRSVIAGEGIRKPYLVYLQKKYGLLSELDIVGWIPNKDRESFLDSIDIFVLPSRTESFGMVVPEAMGRKKVVISTKCGGPEEIINDGIDGFLVNNQDHKALAEKIEYVIRNKKEMKQIQLAVYEKVLREYDINSVKHKLNILISSMLDA